MPFRHHCTLAISCEAETLVLGFEPNPSALEVVFYLFSYNTLSLIFRDTSPLLELLLSLHFSRVHASDREEEPGIPLDVDDKRHSCNDVSTYSLQIFSAHFLYITVFRWNPR